VWWLQEWEDWIDNPELGPMAFQLGTRPLLTCESPIGDAWKRRLLSVAKEDVFLNRFSPTGFYSSAVNNRFLRELRQRMEHEVGYADEPSGECDTTLDLGSRNVGVFYVTPKDRERVDRWRREGFTEPMRTPDHTLVFVRRDKAVEIRLDQKNCIGCLSQCLFSSWSQHTENHGTGRKADPRSYCIQKTLQAVRHEQADAAEIDRNLMFSGRNVHRFSTDPYYANGFIPTVKQLVARLLTGR
jgi:nitronate monooxygenase